MKYAVPKKNRRTGKTKRLFIPGLHPKAFPVSVRGYLDADYIDKLSPEDQKWLAAFNEQHYGGSFSRDPFGVSPEERRACYRRKNAANRDAYSYASAGGRLVADDVSAYGANEHEHRDLQPTQSYLDKPEYKAALANYREQLPQSANKPNKSSNAKKTEQALRKLEIAKGHTYHAKTAHAPAYSTEAPGDSDRE